MRKWWAFGGVAAAAGLSLLPISAALAAPAPLKTVPTITQFHAKPLIFASTGGVLHYSADLTQTRTYTLAVTPTIDRLPRTLRSHKKVSGILRIPANHTNHTKRYLFVLRTWDGVAKRVVLTVRPAPVTIHPSPPPTTTTTRPAPTTTTTVSAPPPTTLPAPTTTLPAPTTTLPAPTTTLPAPTTTLPAPTTTLPPP